MQVCRALLQPVSVQDTIVDVVCNGGAGPLLCHKGPYPTRAEEAGTSWNQLEPAGYSPYTSTCSLWFIDFSLGQLLDFSQPPIRTALGISYLHTGTALGNPSSNWYTFSNLTSSHWDNSWTLTSSTFYRDVSWAALQSCSVNQTKQWAYFFS